MPDQVDIYNMALSLLEEGRRIQSVDEEYVQARRLNEIYESVRDETLELHNWNFAMVRASIPASAVKPDHGWSYQYPLPKDCIRLIPPTYDGDFEERRIPHELEMWQSGDDQSWIRMVLTNEPAPLKIRYIMRITDPVQFSPLFVQALVARLALAIAHRTTGKQSYVERVQKQYQVAMQQAIRQDSKQGVMPRPYPRVPSWVDIRKT